MGGKGGGGGFSYSPPNIGQIANAIGQIDVKPSEYETQLANYANQYWNQTSPLRGYFIQDFQNFLRPPTSVTTTTTNPSTQTTTTGTAKIPSYNDIYSNLSDLYTAASPTMGGRNYWDFEKGPTERDFLTNLGYNPDQNLKDVANLQYDPATQQPILGDFLKTKAQDIFNAQVAKSLQSGTTNTQTQTTKTQTTPSGYTSSGLYNPYNLPGYAPLYQLARTGIESQYNPARENILSSVPRGGALASSLAGLEMGRAQQAGALPATIAAPLITDIMNKAYGVAFNAPQTAIAGLSAADQGLSSRFGSTLGTIGSIYGANSAAQMQAAALSQQAGLASATGLGSLIGSGIGMGVKALGK